MSVPEFDSQLLINSLNTALVMVDRDLTIEFVNHAGEALFETGKKQLYGHKLTDFFMPDTIDDSRLRAAFRHGEDFTENEVTLSFGEHRNILVDLTVTNLQTPHGPRLLFEVKKIDKQKRISRENFQNAQHYAARELVRGLAHEIKNPLGGIRGAAQLLEKELQGQQVEFTQMIIEQSDRLRNLVDRLLGPNSLPQFHWSNLHEALEKVRSLVGFEASPDIALTRDYDPSIPSIRIDQEMIQQAVLNIVRNSIQALSETEMANPNIVLRTRVERQMTIHGKRYSLVARVEIIDNGPGIPTHIKDTLFYPMVSSKSNGSGLGLSIAQTLINHHNGKIDVESVPGRTTFVIFLPIHRKECEHEQ